MVHRHGPADMPWRLNPRGSGAKTGAGTLRGCRQQKSRRCLAFGQPWGHRCRQYGVTSRNMCVGRKTIFDTSQVDLGRVPVSVRSPWIGTTDAMHAADVDSSRLRYDDCR